MSAYDNADNCVKFNLFDLCNGELKKLLESVENKKVCIVSVFGKSSLISPGFKTSVIAKTLGRNICEPDETKNEGLYSENKCNVVGYYDPKISVIFLHLHGISDTEYIIKVCRELENSLKEKSFLELWCDLQYHYAKTLLLLFSFSHVVIVVHPNSSFDLSYIYLFRTLESIRHRAIPWLAEQLKGFDISEEWIHSGRPCSPRVLFVFETCLLKYLPDDSSASEATARFKPKKLPPIKRLEHSLEDQIYRILRKSRIVTNNSGNSLFAIPANQEFVYIFDSKPYISDPVGFFLNQIRLHSQLAKENDITVAKSKSCKRNTPSPSLQESAFLDHTYDPPEKSERNFSTFLQQHIKVALTKGFDDNVGRHPIPAFFELPMVHTWFEIATKLYSSSTADYKEGKNRGIHLTLKNALDIDVKFSEVRCSKVLPLASAAYQENLPPHYTEEYHLSKLAHAIQVFTLHARGPAFQRYVQQLKEDCERLWKSGHQMCEFLSLTGNHCINPKHRTEDDDEEEEEEENKSLPVMHHCSQIKIISACDCGRKQATREDPFDIKAANFDFYVSQMSHCCEELERIEFPVFQASTDESYPAHISPVHSKETSDDAKEEKGKEINSVSNPGTISNTLKIDLSSENFEDCSLPAADTEQPANEDEPLSQNADGRDEIIISIQDSSDSSNHKDKGITRQPSTTEYLPGMLHSESPPSLLPIFSSWSLVCLGPSSLYSHNIGLQDQPGFIQGTNFLLPWDVTVKVEHNERWPALWEGKRPLGMKTKKAIRDGPQFNVKIFIGVEYECRRGHRFMCSGPDRVLRVTSSGLVKDNALKVTGCDMPLYFPCPCRSSKPQMGQLMRIHVVTPKAPVHVTLNPRVQPGPEPCPIFFPTTSEPVKLSQSAYWVLRLPFVYEGDNGPFIPPREHIPVESSRLLKGTYNIAEQQSTR